MAAERWSAHFTEPLTYFPTSPNRRSSTSFQTSGFQPKESPTKDVLQRILVTLERSQSRETLQDALKELSKLDKQPFRISTEMDDEEDALERTVMSKLLVYLYAESLDAFLSQSIEMDNEIEWWSNVERSSAGVAWYLLQTLPERLLRLSSTIINTLGAQNIPVSLSQFTPSSLRRLFPPNSSLRPPKLLTALFPHLGRGSHGASVSSSSMIWLSMGETTKYAGESPNLLQRISSYFRMALASLTLPIRLSRDECRDRRRQLERLRDNRATTLGQLSQNRAVLAEALEKEWLGNSQQNEHLRPFSANLNQLVHEKRETTTETAEESLNGGPPLLSILEDFATVTLPLCHTNHKTDLEPLRRPSRLVRLWPKLLFLPPIGLYAIRAAYVSRSTLYELAKDAKETVRGFFVSWLLEPLKDVAETVRTGGGENVIVQKEAVQADIDSLERMSLSLAKEHLNYTVEQLEGLSTQIRAGDLTPVLKIYEEDIRSPIKSAVTGTLLRTLFIQIQKAKVDIDQALTGIDKLLKSQELTFAFVGVAPAFAIVYFVGGFARQLFFGTGRESGRYGGKSARASTMYALRRVERLLVSENGEQNITPLTTGLLLLSVAHLRSYGEKNLPNRSRFREGFLQDVEDLENPEFGRKEKSMVIDRMWRSWGQTLGWGKVAAEGNRR